MPEKITAIVRQIETEAEMIIADARTRARHILEDARAKAKEMDSSDHTVDVGDTEREYIKEAAETEAEKLIEKCPERIGRTSKKGTAENQRNGGNDHLCRQGRKGGAGNTFTVTKLS